ncbi:MAG: hypothetical protein ACI4LP_11150 [Anaerovoracaceae bacterium]
MTSANILTCIVITNIVMWCGRMFFSRAYRMARRFGSFCYAPDFDTISY